jgi:hypothetical protein
MARAKPQGCDRRGALVPRATLRETAHSIRLADAGPEPTGPSVGSTQSSEVESYAQRN